MDHHIYEKISKLQINLNHHRSEIRNFLASEFPLGCLVHFMVRDGQKTPTVGAVVSHFEDKVRVKMRTKAETARDYHWTHLNKL